MILLCNQPILGNILGYSPGLTQNGIGNFYGIGDAEGQVSNEGELNPATLGVGTLKLFMSSRILQQTVLIETQLPL